MANENEHDGVVIENDEQADAVIDAPSVQIDAGAEKVEMPVADVQKLQRALKTALAQKAHWRGKAQSNPPAAAPGNTPNAPQKPDERVEALAGSVETLKLAEDKRQFGYAHKLSPEETDGAFALARGLGMKPAQVLEHPLFKNGLAGMRSENANSNASPGTSHRSVVVEGKTFEKMTADERRSNFDSVVQATQKR